MVLVKPNWYGFDHVKVDEMFKGGLTFVNDFCVNSEYKPSAIYRAATPDTSKGHKKYMLLTNTDSGFVVRGMDEQQIEQFRFQDAIHCRSCGDVIYSVMRHDFRSCTCGNVSIDGGRDYTKVSYQPNADYQNMVVDLLTDTISDPKTPHGEEEKVQEADSASGRTDPAQQTS